jgi:hypothetical protein
MAAPLLETGMNHYKVLASNPKTSGLALLDAKGRCHLGRSLDAAPRPGTELVGEPPSVGLRALRVAREGRPCPVVLVLLDCHHGAAVRLIEAQP